MVGPGKSTDIQKQIQFEKGALIYVNNMYNNLLIEINDIKGVLAKERKAIYLCKKIEKLVEGMAHDMLIFLNLHPMKRIMSEATDKVKREEIEDEMNKMYKRLMINEKKVKAKYDRLGEYLGELNSIVYDLKGESEKGKELASHFEAFLNKMRIMSKAWNSAFKLGPKQRWTKDINEAFKEGDFGLSQ